MMSGFLLFYVLAAALCSYGVWRWWRVSSMRKWEKGVARIVKFEEQERSCSYKGMRWPYFVPTVQFVYEVRGKEYTGSRFSVHNVTIGAKGELDAAIGGATVGASVQVFYDPVDPRRATLTLPSYDGVII